MVFRVAGVCCVLLLASGCASKAPPVAAVTHAGAERMEAAASFAEKRVVARENCAEAGLAANTREFARCVTTYHAIEASRLKQRARTLAERAARQRGLCLDLASFEFGRCIEI